MVCWKRRQWSKNLEKELELYSERCTLMTFWRRWWISGSGDWRGPLYFWGLWHQASSRIGLRAAKSCWVWSGGGNHTWKMCPFQVIYPTSQATPKSSLSCGQSKQTHSQVPSHSVLASSCGNLRSIQPNIPEQSYPNSWQWPQWAIGKVSDNFPVPWSSIPSRAMQPDRPSCWSYCYLSWRA